MKDNTFNEAKQLYLEQYASAIVTSGYLKIAVALLSLVVLGLVFMNLKIVRTLESFKPMVIRIDEIGRAQAVAYESLAYKPEYKETKYFLTRFCQLYYRRNRSTINDDFSQALYFLDGKLAGDTIQQFKQKNIIKAFLSDSLAPEKDIDVQQVVIEPMDKAPYKATVDFFEIEYSPADHSVAKRRLYTASFLFSFRDHIPNADILTNPLGLTITYFRGRRGVHQVIRNSLFVSAAALILVLFGLMSRLNFLAASKKALFLHCGASMAVFIGILGLNLFAAALAINRKILLKDTGRKLSHFDNQMQAESPEGLPPFLAERR